MHKAIFKNRLRTFFRMSKVLPEGYAVSVVREHFCQIVQFDDAFFPV